MMRSRFFLPSTLLAVSPAAALGVVLSLGVVSVDCGKSPPQYLDGVTYPESTYKPGMTYYKDVLPITQSACQSCHTTGGIGPFPLLTYADAQAHHAQMSGSVQSRSMPPWMPSQNCQSFKGARTLTQDQIDTIFSWSKDNAPEGNPADAPAPPPNNTPTLTGATTDLDIGGDYTPVTTDDYRCFVMDPKLAADTDLVAYDFVPGVRAEVHHVLVYSGSLAEMQGKDQAGPGVGYTCYGGPAITSPQLVAAWVPGSGATIFPTGTGIPLKAGAGLVMQIHYNTLNGASPDRSKLRLQYSTARVPRPAILTSLSQTQFSIPAGAQGYSASNTLTTPNNLTLWGLAPHMHTLGRRAQIAAQAPDNSSQCLIDIPAWDFHWQQLYMYNTATGISLAKGTKITLTCTWDNPTGSAIRWGEATTDEMCINYFYVTQ
ncbi:MAG TPA: hypothetical protein PKI03_31995 [Pseudomonadota bacterium]|nr:hypothetical protein [Pseudomonadota bacterium]